MGVIPVVRVGCASVGRSVGSRCTSLELSPATRARAHTVQRGGITKRERAVVGMQNAPWHTYTCVPYSRTRVWYQAAHTQQQFPCYRGCPATHGRAAHAPHHNMSVCTNPCAEGSRAHVATATTQRRQPKVLAKKPRSSHPSDPAVSPAPLPAQIPCHRSFPPPPAPVPVPVPVPVRDLLPRSPPAASSFGSRCRDCPLSIRGRDGTIGKPLTE